MLSPDKSQAAGSNTRTAIGSAPVHKVRRAIGFLQSGRYGDARKLAERLRRAHPDVAIIADILANAQAATGDPDAAEKNFRAALKLDPKYAETRSNFGRFLVERGRFDEAIAMLGQALNLAPGMTAAMVHLGVAFNRNLDRRRAAAVLLASLKIAPNNAEAHAEMGRVLINDNLPEQALAHLEKALALGAEPAENHLWTARALSALGRTAEALELLEKARAIAPKNPDCLFERALIHQALGDFDSARREFRKAMEMAPKAGRLHRSFLTSEKLQAGDPLIARMEDALRDPGLSDDSRANFGFALAKAMEDTGQHERVFAYLRPANELMSKRFPFDFDALRDQTHAMMESLADADFNSMDIPGRPDYAPLFVTGLPRSGTTLVEQIVASHSAVTGGGELGYARRAWDDALFGGKGAARPWSGIGGRAVADIGRGIEARMRARFGDADRVTDKSVQSYMLMGPIMASLPESRFIVVKRDPRDNLLSMYRNIFADGRHRQSYSLRGLARHYRLHEEVLSFWQEKLPGGFHSVEYEKLVENPEAEARALIAACGLEWEDACLNFHKSGRKVDTLSLHQVRQPIYSSSLQAWRRHEGELTELLEELGGEYAPGAKPE